MSGVDMGSGGTEQEGRGVWHRSWSNAYMGGGVLGGLVCPPVVAMRNTQSGAHCALCSPLPLQLQGFDQLQHLVTLDHTGVSVIRLPQEADLFRETQRQTSREHVVFRKQSL